MAAPDAATGSLAQAGSGRLGRPPATLGPMSSRQPRDQRSGVPRRASAGGRGAYDPATPDPARAPAPSRKGGPHIGPLAITPLRVTLMVALVGGLAFLAYSLLIRDALQVPLMATGFAVCGIVMALMALLALVAVIRAGREGRDGTAVLAALGGGILAVGAMMCLAAATIFAMIWSGTKAG